MLDPLQLQRTVDLRRGRCTLRRVGKVLEAPPSTFGRVLKPWVLDGSGTRSPQSQCAATSGHDPAT